MMVSFEAPRLITVLTGNYGSVCEDKMDGPTQVSQG